MAFIALCVSNVEIHAIVPWNDCQAGYLIHPVRYHRLTMNLRKKFQSFPLQSDQSQTKSYAPHVSTGRLIRPGSGRLLSMCVFFTACFFYVPANAAWWQQQSNAQSIKTIRIGNGIFHPATYFVQEPSLPLTKTKPRPIASDNANVRLDMLESLTIKGHNPVALQVRVSPEGAVRKGYIVIRDVPESVELTAGQMIGNPSVWVLSTSDLNSLRLILPAEPPADFSLDVELLGPKGKRLDRRKIHLLTGKSPAKAEEPVRSDSAASLPILSGETRSGKQARLPRNTGTKKPLNITASPAISQAEKDRFRAHGDRLMAHGDIVAARAFYMRLALHDDADGTFSLATTFDPNYLKRRNVFGLKGNLEEARKWYERAASLGSDKAKAMLADLSN